MNLKNYKIFLKLPLNFNICPQLFEIWIVKKNLQISHTYVTHTRDYFVHVNKPCISDLFVAVYFPDRSILPLRTSFMSLRNLYFAILTWGLWKFLDKMHARIVCYFHNSSLYSHFNPTLSFFYYHFHIFFVSGPFARQSSWSLYWIIITKKKLPSICLKCWGSFN